MIDKQNIKIIEINKENNTFICDNGMEYPLLNDEDITIKELQIQVDKAKNIVENILLYGETTES